MATDNSIKIKGEGTLTSHEIPVAWTAKWRAAMTQGAEPHHFYLPITDDYKDELDDMLDYVQNANDGYVFVDLEFTTSDGDSGSRTVTWEGWLVNDVIKDQTLDDIWLVHLSDVREVFRNHKINKKYNIYYTDEEPDSQSLNGSADWQVGDYLQDVVEEFISDMPTPFGGAFTWGGSINMTDTSILNENVPRNLSNTEQKTGGWIGASFKEAVEPIFKAFGVTLLVGIDRKIYVTDKETDRSDIRDLLPGGVENIAMDNSFVSTMDTEWLKPNELELIFEVKKEVAIETLPTTYSDAVGLGLENVLRLPQDPAGTSPETEWTPLDDWASDDAWDSASIPNSFKNGPENYIRKRYFKKEVIPYQYDQVGVPGLGVQKVLKADSYKIDYLNEEIKSSWRRHFKVLIGHGSGNPQRWANIRLGRLTTEGGSRAKGNVFADYVRIRKIGRLEQSDQSGKFTMADFKWTDDVPFDDFTQQPAPFVAYWVDDEDLIMGLQPAGLNAMVFADTIPGRVDKDLGFKDVVQLVNDADKHQPANYKFMLGKRDGELKANYDLRVIANASPMDSNERYHTKTKTIFASNYTVQTQKLRAYGITANYIFSASQLAQSSLMSEAGDTLSNDFALDVIATRVAEEVKRSYEMGYMGGVKSGDIKPLSVDNILAGGECNEMWIEVGGEEKAYSITLNYSIKPAQINITLGRKDLDGQPVKIAV